MAFITVTGKHKDGEHRATMINLAHVIRFGEDRDGGSIVILTSIDASGKSMLLPIKESFKEVQRLYTEAIRMGM